MDKIKVFRHSFRVDRKTGKVTESGDPLQKSETAKRMYYEIFDKLKNKGDWRVQTHSIIVESWTEAQLVAEALTYFLGGAEIETCICGYNVRSKGYYHYMKKGRMMNLKTKLGSNTKKE